jgi:hypothetical protein
VDALFFLILLQKDPPSAVLLRLGPAPVFGDILFLELVSVSMISSSVMSVFPVSIPDLWSNIGATSTLFLQRGPDLTHAVADLSLSSFSAGSPEPRT